MTYSHRMRFKFAPGLPSYPWTSRAYSISSVNGPDQHTDRLHRVEASAVVRPEDPILEFAAVNASGVPDTVKIGLAASVVPPASFVEMGTVTCCRETGMVIISCLRKCVFYREIESKIRCSENIYIQQSLTPRASNIDIWAVSLGVLMQTINCGPILWTKSPRRHREGSEEPL